MPGLLLLALIASVGGNGEAQTDLINKGQGNSSCQSESWETHDAYVGWPHKISCEHDVLYFDDDENLFTCVIRDATTNEILLRRNDSSEEIAETQHYLPDIAHNHTSSYHVELYSTKTGACHSRQTVVLTLYDYVAPACENKTEVKIEKRPEHSKTINVRCSDDSVPSMHVKLGHHDYRVIWKRNCTDVRNISGLRVTEKGRLMIPSVSYDHAGLYSCNLVYKGRVSHTIHMRICVKPPQETGLPGLKCRKPIQHVGLRSRVMIECSFGSGHGSLKKQNIKNVEWFKLGSNKKNKTTECRNHFDITNNGTRPGRFCNFSTRTPCYSHNLTREEIQNFHLFTTLRFWIDDLKDSELGTYMVKVTSKGFALNATVTLEENAVAPLTNIRTVIEVCLAVLVFMVVLCLFLWWKRFFFLLFYKRKFAKFELDDKKYGAFLSYHYSSDMDKFAQQRTRDAAAATLAALESMGYRIYDQQRDKHPGELKVESSLNAMRQCHRVVIILTAEYLKDQWSVFQLHKGFQGMIQSQSKLIFVVLPGAKENIKQYSSEDDTKRLLHKALKLHHNVSWSDDVRFNQKMFKHKLEWAMPKLPNAASSKSSCRPSTRSSLFSQQYVNGFQRTMSVETQVTEAGSPQPSSGEQQFTCFAIETESSQQKATSA